MRKYHLLVLAAIHKDLYSVIILNSSTKIILKLLIKWLINKKKVLLVQIRQKQFKILHIQFLKRYLKFDRILWGCKQYLKFKSVAKHSSSVVVEFQGWWVWQKQEWDGGAIESTRGGNTGLVLKEEKNPSFFSMPAHMVEEKIQDLGFLLPFTDFYT